MRAFFSVTSAALAAMLCLTQCSMGKSPAFKVPERVSKADVDYLKKLAEDTWRSIDAMVETSSQLPYDKASRTDEWTSVTNIGLYVASVAAAVDLGFLPRADAKKRLDTLLTNLNVLVKWNGFPYTWVSVKSGAPAEHDPWISALDEGNYFAGLRVGRAYFPELKKMFSAQIDAADWAALYNPKTKKLKFGYNRKTNDFGGDLNDLGSDSRLACFLAIGTGKVPAESWKSLDRHMEERYNIQYLQPGWQGGGLFMQYISGLMLDERHTFIGLSAANFAYAQIVHARQEKLPVWGWSACQAPSGQYLGQRALKDEIVTPHASALTLPMYPTQAIANLKKLEAMGARAPYELNGQSLAWGFRDSIDIKSGAVANDYLVLDQAMLFLALANFLDNDFAVRMFHKDRDVQKGQKLIPDLQPREYMAENPAAPKSKVSIFQLRDTHAETLVDGFQKIVEKGSYVKKYIVKGIENGEAVRAPAKMKIDGDLAEWAKAVPIMMDADNSAEIIKSEGAQDYKATLYFMWDKTYLYFAAKVSDKDLVFTQSYGDIWKDDVIELFLSPNPNDFAWGRRDCFQIGMAAGGPDGQPQTWAWFQDGPTESNVVMSAKTGDAVVDGQKGYVIEAAIKWSFLKVKPAAGVALGASPAVHFIDSTRANELKLNWCFIPDGKSLGRLVLKP